MSKIVVACICGSMTAMWRSFGSVQELPCKTTYMASDNDKVIMKPEGAIELTIGMQVSEAALEDAAQMIGGWPQWTLYVSPDEYVQSMRILKGMNAWTKDNPTAPFINLQVDKDLIKDQWYLECDGRSVYSKGCW